MAGASYRGSRRRCELGFRAGRPAPPDIATVVGAIGCAHIRQGRAHSSRNSIASPGRS